MRYLICRQEADTIDLVGEPVRRMLDDAHRPFAVTPVDADRQCRGDAVALEQRHQRLNALLLVPCLDDRIGLFATDTGNFIEPDRLLLDHVEGGSAESVDDTLRDRWPDAFDQS